MHIPETPPKLSSLLNKVSQLDSQTKVLGTIRAIRFNQPYYHWDELKYRPLPAGLSREDFWLALKLQRGATYRKLPIRDKQGQQFVFNMPDLLLQRVHEIDIQAGPGMRSDDPFLSPAGRDQYVTSSLMEEAITSSQLEGAPTTRRVAHEMFLTGRHPRDLGERMILNNFQAMRAIQEYKSNPLTIEFILRLHKIITDGTLDKPDAEGRLRHEDEPVQVVDDRDGTIYHQPPAAGTALEQRLKDLCLFANENAISEKTGFIPPVLRAIILHFWLAYEHPFCDGNGRLARSLMYWSMLHQGYWLFEYITISDIIKKAFAQYEEAFQFSETDGNDLTYFLLNQTKVISTALAQLHDYVVRKQREIAKVDPALLGHPELNFRQRSIIARLIKHPNEEVSIAGYCVTCAVTYATGRHDLLELENTGLLTPRKEGHALLYRANRDALAKLILQPS